MAKRKKNISGGAGIAIGVAIGVGATALVVGISSHYKKKKLSAQTARRVIPPRR